MNCPYCGSSLNNGETFCTHCGNNVMMNQQPMYAPQPSNGMAITGFILSFIFPILGLIFSIIGLSKAKQLNNSGKGLAIAGTIISAITIFIAIILLVGGFFIIKPRLQDAINTSIDQAEYYYYDY